MQQTPDFSIPRGDTPAMNLALSNLWTASGAPFSLTFSAKGDLNVSTPYAIQWTVSGIQPTISGATNASYQFTPAQTYITPGTYNYDFKLVNSNGQLVMHTPVSVFEIAETATL